ncbi:MAG: hypothetical protein HYR75_08295, partial [Gemmatimonadetes bacterium]|nr:hypothetical protein [Gemmatimonadota bacterium]
VIAGGRGATAALRALVAQVAGEPAVPGNAVAGSPVPAMAPALTTTDAAPWGAGTTARDVAKPSAADGKETLSAHDATSALDAARTLAAADPSIIVRDLAALQPAFREKVERVVERMKSEYGHDVTVAETWRSQTRQDSLVQQGRTRPGPIVTWTRQSRHTDGTAVDLVVDGSWNDAQGYQQLARVAAEEGLQTLGPRDPGHVQLPGDRALRDIASVATISEIHVASTAPRAVAALRSGTSDAIAVPARTAAAIAPDVVAPVAAVATVARVADVARVAPVALPGETPRARRAESAARTTRAERPVRTDSSDRPEPTPSAVRQETHRTPSRAPIAPSADAATAARIADVRSAISGAARQAVGTSATPVSARSDIGARIDQVQALLDVRDAQPASQMLLRIDGADGSEDRIRVGVRGTSVGATIDVRDPATADQMTSRIQELNDALAARGLSADAVHVRAASVAGTSSASELSRGLFASADPAALRSGTLFAEPSASGSRSRDDAPGQKNQQDPSRYRSRREQKGGAQ